MGVEFKPILQKFPDLEYERAFSFRRHTTVGVGGCAPYACYPRNAEALAALVLALRREKIPYYVLGNGSNLLVSDAGFAGIAIVTRQACALRAEGDTLYAECGTMLSSVLGAAVDNRLGGLAFLYGIPATVGGAVFMNAGAGGRYVADVVRSVTALIDGQICRLSAEECAFAYKDSVFMRADSCILSAEFVAPKDNLQSILSDIERVKQRRATLPRGRSMGCVFRNPGGLSAGTLIERAGCKGLYCGGAVVSEQHANFMLNRGNATARDFKTLIESVRARVCASTGIRLNEEIRYVGEI